MDIILSCDNCNKKLTEFKGQIMVYGDMSTYCEECSRDNK